MAVTDISTLDVPAMEIGKDRIVVSINPAAAEAGIEVGKHCWDAFGKLESIPPEDKEFFLLKKVPPQGGTKCVFCMADEAVSAGEHVTKVLDTGTVKYEAHWEPTGKGTYLHYAFLIS